MVRIKHLALGLDLLQFPGDTPSWFRFRTRYVCNYLERVVLRDRLGFFSEDYHLILILGATGPLGDCCVVPDRSLVSAVCFCLDQYKGLATPDTHEFHLRMLSEGLEKCDASFRVPLQELSHGMDMFRAGGYRNEWTHKTRSFKGIGTKARLLCALTTDAFHLRLQLERKSTIVYDEEILITRPDELIFTPSLGDVHGEDGRVVVKDHFGDVLVSVDPDAYR